jgi:alpha-tubulin suppressor-like RCC1 family protein
MPAVERRMTGPRLRGALGVVAALLFALSLAIAAPAQAHESWGAKAWGWNNHGQLGDGTSTGPEECGPAKEACSVSPVEVKGLGGVTALAGGEAHSLALLENGTVVAWGDNTDGELGDGSTTGSDVPVPVKGLTGATAIAAGNGFSLALLNNGSVAAWGQGQFDELGDGKATNSEVPVAVSGLSEATAIAAGGRFGLALLKNGTVMSWGGNSHGQLGNGSTTASDTPVAVSGLNEVTAIAAGNNHALALLKDGTVMAWGENTLGQLGDGSEADSHVPVAVSKLSGVSAITAGLEHSIALLSNGTVTSWGGNEKGQLGDGTSTGPEMCGSPPTKACSKTPVTVSGSSGTSAVAASSSGEFGLVLRSGFVDAWGANGDGQIGDGSPLPGPEPCGPGSCSTKPLQVSKLALVKGIAGGGAHGLAFGPTPPVVTGVSPNEPRRSGATHVTIVGSEFEEASQVRFGSTDASGVVVRENGSVIEAVAPAGKGTVDVTVTTPIGTSATSEADRFYYSRPAVKKVSPRKGPEAGGTSVTITGTNLTGVTSVNFGSREAKSFEVKSGTEIVATSPSHSGGLVDVTVSAANGTSAITHKDHFRYT